MKKQIISLFALFLLCAVGVQAQLIEKKADGTYKVLSGNVYFPQNGSNDQWGVSTTQGSAYQSALDISGIGSIFVGDATDVALANYAAPTYADYYLNVSSWANRSSWNLSNVHDPSVMKAADGYYYMYQTDASYGNAHSGHGHFFCRRSKDLVNWEFMGSTMSSVPKWVLDSVNSYRSKMGLASIASSVASYGYWAPCARKVNDRLYRMYYCIVVDNYIKTGKVNTTANFDKSWTEHAFIGMMETSTPADISSWVDKGFVTTSSTDKGATGYARSSTSDWSAYFKWNAIDPSYIITPSGEHWLVYGSWHSGIVAMQLNPSTGKALTTLGNPWGDISAYGKQIYSRTSGSRWQGSEAPEVVYHDGYYYMFLAYDELSVAYNTRVVRSKNINGPYYNFMGADCTSGGNAYPIVTHPYKFGSDHGWVGISHCAVFDDGAGNWYYASQQRFPANYSGNAYSNAVMLGGVRRIIWTQDGWPVVLPERYGAVPQASISEDDIVGTWENVNLVYSSGKQLTSTDISFNANHTVTGGSAPFNGKDWSFDATSNVITVGSTYKLYVSREIDWESSSRTPTLVFAGLPASSASTPTTYWGKKVSSAASDVTVVGSADYTNAFWTTFSDYYTIPANKTLHLNFVNHNSGADSNWDNWLVALTTDADRNAATGYSEYVVLRSDAYGWQGTKNTTDATWYTSFANNFNWTTFVSDMNGATVDLTVTRSGAQATIDAEVTTTAGKSYYEKMVLTCGTGTQPIRAFLTCEKSYLSIDNAQTTIK